MESNAMSWVGFHRRNRVFVVGTVFQDKNADNVLESAYLGPGDPAKVRICPETVCTVLGMVANDWEASGRLERLRRIDRAPIQLQSKR